MPPGRPELDDPRPERGQLRWLGRLGRNLLRVRLSWIGREPERAGDGHRSSGRPRRGRPRGQIPRGPRGWPTGRPVPSSWSEDTLPEIDRRVGRPVDANSPVRPATGRTAADAVVRPSRDSDPMATALAPATHASPLVGIVRRRPLASAIVLYALFEGVHAAMAVNGGTLLDAVANGLRRSAWTGPLAIYAALAVAPVALLGWWRQTGLDAAGSPPGAPAPPDPARSRPAVPRGRPPSRGHAGRPDPPRRDTADRPQRGAVLPGILLEVLRPQAGAGRSPRPPSCSGPPTR